MRELRWTGEQATAILETGDALLAASAGTGKTTTVIGKVLWRLGHSPGARRDTGEELPAHPDP
ncbi:MAG: UvrD-helicase domain-containing protein, partial [Gemmatimonadetes bacterium]|nr:UvrD-helicase domain-containing protein [Gemmatimonadota bacterium]NIT86695.1 UvrD-helicase domain-containing protein [Gemmatimonadota bacterium]NIU30556.1 UvrD-helicase domain-containing protein [Gemmatimonadota bacterium]NIW63623.1 UvrD-helicase domain-containing protein [Gemmatimonadota bacterium]NIX38962.1 UvrD-helicase domain-containing protein [Gemmatimonadota bacterium]